MPATPAAAPGDRDAGSPARSASGAGRASALPRLRATTLCIAAPDPLAARALDRAKLALLDAPIGAPHGIAAGPDMAAWALAGCLAAGLFDVAGRGLRTLSERGDDPATAALLALLATHYAAWTADLGTLRGVGFDDVVPDPLALAQRARAERAPRLDGARASLAAYAAGRSDEAFRRWWPAVEARDAAPAAPGAASPGAPAEVAAANVIVPLVYGLLGAEPDARRGRLRLRPQPPVAWDWLEIERLRVADAEVSLDYRRDGARHTLRVAQTRGAVPLRLVLEPLLPARRLAAARVDGRDARLDARRFGERLLVPVQLVLDHERSLEIHVEDDAPADDAA